MKLQDYNVKIVKDVIWLILKKCIKCNIKQPCFNYPNETQRLYCTDCKKCGMVDIKDKKCINGNLTRATKQL